MQLLKAPFYYFLLVKVCNSISIWELEEHLKNVNSIRNEHNSNVNYKHRYKDKSRTAPGTLGTAPSAKLPTDFYAFRASTSLTYKLEVNIYTFLSSLHNYFDLYLGLNKKF